MSILININVISKLCKTQRRLPYIKIKGMGIPIFDTYRHKEWSLISVIDTGSVMYPNQTSEKFRMQAFYN